MTQFISTTIRGRRARENSPKVLVENKNCKIVRKREIPPVPKTLKPKKQKRKSPISH
jgi:hypothetical protein